jgi:choline dehydrogenase-like flavoprotein
MRFEKANRNLSDTVNGKWDAIVIGGGITGAGIFRDLAIKGYRVLLLEQNDFAFGTSSRSSKLVHGGLRYLANGQFNVTVNRYMNVNVSKNNTLIWSNRWNSSYRSMNAINTIHPSLNLGSRSTTCSEENGTMENIRIRIVNRNSMSWMQMAYVHRFIILTPKWMMPAWYGGCCKKASAPEVLRSTIAK